MDSKLLDSVDVEQGTANGHTTPVQQTLTLQLQPDPSAAVRASNGVSRQRSGLATPGQSPTAAGLEPEEAHLLQEHAILRATGTSQEEVQTTDGAAAALAALGRPSSMGVPLQRKSSFAWSRSGQFSSHRTLSLSKAGVVQEHESMSPSQLDRFGSGVLPKRQPSGDISEAGGDGRQPGAGRPGAMAPVQEGLGEGVADDISPDKEVVLRLEYISQRELKGTFSAVWLSVVAAVAMLIAIGVRQNEEFGATYVSTDTTYVIGFCFAAVSLVAEVVLLIFFLFRLHLLHKINAHWTIRRWHLSMSFFTVLVAVVVLDFARTFTNLYVLIPTYKCHWFDNVIVWFGLFENSAWSVVVLIFLINSHNTWVWTKAKGARSDFSIVLDAPWWYHWRKIVLVAIGEAIAIAEFVFTLAGQKTLGDVINDPPLPNCMDNIYNCEGTFNLGEVITNLMSAGVDILFFILFAVYLVCAWRQLKLKAYNKYKFGHVFFRLQARLMTFTFALSVAQTVFQSVVGSPCEHYVWGSFGFVPWQLAISGMTITTALLVMPKDPRKVNMLLQEWLQEFAWSEDDKPAKLADRSAHLIKVNADLEREPMFCFETALKLSYWASVVYRYKWGTWPDSEFKLDVAMGLYRLQHLEMFLEPLHDTKCLVAWNSNTIVLSFRGTVTVRNMLSDIRMWQTAHRPVRGKWWTRPRVHRGFMDTWTSNGLDEKVLAFLRSTLKEGNMVEEDVMVYVAGHSLGGAVAMLCAFDIAQQFRFKHLQCYTYGAPRPGNHTWVKEYNSIVPDTWHLVNGQDIVPRQGKLIGLYKQPGHRVLINKRGDLIVRPSFLEARLIKSPLDRSVSDHLMGAYRTSLYQICRSQFVADRSFRGGALGVLEVAEKLPLDDILLQQDFSLDDVRTLSETCLKAGVKDGNEEEDAEDHEAVLELRVQRMASLMPDRSQASQANFTSFSGMARAVGGDVMLDGDVGDLPMRSEPSRNFLVRASLSRVGHMTRSRVNGVRQDVTAVLEEVV